MTFSQQLITELSENLSSTVSLYIKETIFINTAPRDIVAEVMEEYLSNGSSPDVIRKIMRDHRKNRKSRRTNWSGKVKREYRDDPMKPSHPFYNIWYAYQNLSHEDKVKLGWNCPLEEIIDRKMQDIEQWRGDPASYLIDFPCISMFKPQKIYPALKSDIFCDIYDYLNERYHLNIHNFQRLYPDTFIGNPIFGVDKEVLHLEQSDEDEHTLIEKLALTKDSIFYTIINADAVNPGKPVKSLGQQDLTLIQKGIFNFINDNFYQERTVITKLRVFAQLLCPTSKPNRHYIKMAGERILSYQDFRYKGRNLKKGIAGEGYDLFDHIQIINPTDFEGTADDPYSPDATVYIHFGDRLYQEIIQEQIVGITQSAYEKVDSELAHMIAPILQMQRTILSKALPHGISESETDALMTKSYDYLFFAGSIRTLSKRKKENLRKLRDAIKEYASERLYIKTFHFVNDTFTLTFFPLSKDELADIQINKSTPSTGQLTMSDLIAADLEDKR